MTKKTSAVDNMMREVLRQKKARQAAEAARSTPKREFIAPTTVRYTPRPKSRQQEALPSPVTVGIPFTGSKGFSLSSFPSNPISRRSTRFAWR